MGDIYYGLEPYKQGNIFSVSLMGHANSIPLPATPILKEDYDADTYAKSLGYFNSLILELNSDTNYNRLYDSYYAPADFRLRAITIAVGNFLPEPTTYNVFFKINGAVIETLPVPTLKDHNQVTYGFQSCEINIWEDDFVEVEIQISDSSVLDWTKHNVMVGIAGCFVYTEYKDMFSSMNVNVSPTTNFDISSTFSVIDGVTVYEGFLVLLKEQVDTTENGVWEVYESGGFYRLRRYAGIATVTELSNLIIGVSAGSNCTTCTEAGNYFGVSNLSYTTTIPEFGTCQITFSTTTMDWESGQKYYKTNMTIQNRSGYDILKNRYIIAEIRSPINFLVQGIRLSCIEDFLMPDSEKIHRSYGCFYLDVLINGISLLSKLGLDNPISLDTLNASLVSYNLSTQNNVNGYPVIIGDEVMLKIYSHNSNAVYNSRIFESILIGCTEDCVNLEVENVTVFKLCANEPCKPKFALDVICDPNKTAKAAASVANSNNPEVSIVTQTFVQKDGEYVTINGQYIFVKRPTR